MRNELQKTEIELNTPKMIPARTKEMETSIRKCGSGEGILGKKTVLPTTERDEFCDDEQGAVRQDPCTIQGQFERRATGVDLPHTVLMMLIELGRRGNDTGVWSGRRTERRDASTSRKER